MRKVIASLATSAMLLGGAAAVTMSPAGAQEDEAPSEEAPEERPEPGTQLRDALDGLVSLGVLTQEQADTVFDTLTESFGDREGGPRGPGGHQRGGASFGVVAETIGIEVEELREAVSDGATIAEIAEENGVDPQDVIDALGAQTNERLDEAVANGRLDEAEADEKRADAEQRATDFVNGDLERPEGRGGPGGPFGGPDRDAESEDTAA